MAKKKGSRKAASRGARKKVTPRRTPRRAAAPRTGLENPKQVNLEPLKAIITAQIKRLEGYEPRPEVENALKILRDTKATLSSACVSTRIPMVIEL